MKNQNRLYRLSAGLTALMLFNVSASAHDQVHMENIGALVLHIISAPEHVLMLVIGIAGLAWLVRRKLPNQRRAKIQRDK